MKNDYLKFELQPSGGQKSFYGKAIVTHANGKKHLTSYETDVCTIVDGEFLRTWDGYSATTMKHINSFRIQYKMDPLTKKQWLKLPVHDNTMLTDLIVARIAMGR